MKLLKIRGNIKIAILSILEVNNLIINVVRKDIKNIHLNILPPHGDVRVTVPLKKDQESIRLFIISKLSWIKKQRNKFFNQERESKKEYISGESHYFKGDRYLLNVIPSLDKPRVLIRNNRFIDLFVNKNFSKEKRKKIMEEWYRDELKKILPQKINEWSKVTKIQIEDLRVRRMKTKWGTCNKDKKRIWINLELIKKPTPYLDYVIVHELVHFLERKHNDQFVKYMNKFLPSWRTIKTELNSFILTHESWGTK